MSENPSTPLVRAPFNTITYVAKFKGGTSKASDDIAPQGRDIVKKFFVVGWPGMNLLPPKLFLNLAFLLISRCSL